MSEPNVLIVTTAHNGEDGRLVRHKNALERNGISTEIVSISCSSRVKRLVVGPIQAYLKVIRSKPICVILPDPELHLFLPFLLRKKTYVISDVHEDYELVLEDRDWLPRWLKPLLLRLIRVVAKARDSWSHAVIIAAESLQVNNEIYVGNRPNPLDLPQSQSLSVPYRLVYVGDIRTSRGLIEMLNLTEITPDVCLDLIGPCEESHFLIEQIERRGLSERVIWHGRLSYEDSWEIASKALAGLSLLRPTKAFEKSIPTKVWEYWALGLPVLASDLSSQAKLISESGGGFVGNVENLSRIVSNFVKDPPLSRRYGEVGRSYYLTQEDGSEDRLLILVRSELNRRR